MADVRVLCVLSTVLGNSIRTTNLIDVLDHLPGTQPTYLVLRNEDFKRYPAPWWARITDAWQAEYVVRQKARALRDCAFDLLIVNTWEFMVAFKHLARQMPSTALIDAVPATLYAAQERRGRVNWKRRFGQQIHSCRFADAVKHFTVLLPKTSDCAQSLTEDYGVSSDRCIVTLNALKLDVWRPEANAKPGSRKLLFVGNDFSRKGGEFLLELYSQHLGGSCTLTIASNDPSLARRSLPFGVRLLRGVNREHLLSVYRESDLLVFPSTQDYGPEVVAEALAVGVPCIVTDIPGVRDLVIDGETGFRIPSGASMERWASLISRLLSNPAELAKLSVSSRQFAERMLGFDRFASIVSDVLRRLTDEARLGSSN